MPSLRLVEPDLPAPIDPPATTNETRWAIGGWPAVVAVWTAEEWACLAVKPLDAARCPNGSWVRLWIA